MYKIFKYFKTVIKFAVICLISMAGMEISGENKEVSQITVCPKENNVYLINPGKGWILYNEFSGISDDVWKKVSIGYARFTWKDIHIADNKFNWELIDSNLAYCAKHGKRFAFGIMPILINSKDDWKGMPDWLIDAGAKYYHSLTVPECNIPVWDDPVFIEKMNQFVSALAKKYNGNPNIEFIDCRTFGNWGEWHLGAGAGGKDPGNEIKKKYIDQWAVFDKTNIILPVSGSGGMKADGYEFYARNKYGFGAREDSSEYQPRWKTCLSFLNYGPAIGEWSFPYSKIKNGEGWTHKKWHDDMLPGQILGSKYSYQPLGEWNNDEIKDSEIFLREKGELVDQWQNKMGYWFKMTEASYPVDLANGKSGNITFSIRNDGVAPIYIKGNTAVVKAALLDADNRILESLILKGINPFDWKPEHIIRNSAEISFNKNDKASKIAIGVFSREGIKNPDIKLGIDNGSEENWYLLSDMPKTHKDIEK